MNRRQLITTATASLLGSTLPTRMARASSASDRKFLFIFNGGGWDPFCTFVPSFGSPHIEMEPEAEPAFYGDIPVVEHPSRPSFSTFMAHFSDRLHVINGIEVRSVTHQRCRQLMMTNKAGAKNIEDWPTLIAANSPVATALPHVVFRGPAYSSQLSDSVVRVGINGQLNDLLIPHTELQQTQSLTDAFLHAELDRVQHREATASPLIERYQHSLAQQGVLGQSGLTTELGGIMEGCVRDIRHDAANAFSLFEQGLSRCAMMSYLGVCDLSWDTHADHQMQQESTNDLFWYLTEIIDDLDGRVSLSGRPLREEVILVVMSEMGRSPRFNVFGGRDHWTYNSAMLFGDAIKGGRVSGGLNEHAIGMPIDLSSGQISANGIPLLPGHLGSTLLTLADIDPLPLVGEEYPAVHAAF